MYWNSHIQVYQQVYKGLTLTWDVLKCMIIPSNRLEERD